MSKADAGPSLQGVRVEPRYSYDKNRSKSRSVDFVYVNSAYVGSVNDVNQSRLEPPPTTVIREQYWACSKWPMGQRILAITVGVLLGTVIGLTILVVIRGDDDNFPDILRRVPVED
ncbi:unnamed protein product [Pieris macdunnoughi]|uniref:Uncharacterized protein n=1 Tax=Pieris macdunnoughi TaxID=345717 RepID=A0A821TKN2_9NEOP|nr:unnamed protein product [Pieris macdunnoughi]